ncbi:hypothetical protein CHS0354_001545 [Potamilus streckersoni]|uniref:Uncharacterized protein n=1 Tax=Potamilus streckersoni TaxID=2493646 RepID=A0AAE0VYF1_9BIVA|nr:hypothetical protein CHS0354_001545 [Potamilus streckersoni]
MSVFALFTLADYVVILCIAVGILFADDVSAQLQCRICDGAKYLDDCHTSASCSYDEICYMDFRSIDGLHYQYWGGCRSKVDFIGLDCNMPPSVRLKNYSRLPQTPNITNVIDRIKKAISNDN